MNTNGDESLAALHTAQNVLYPLIAAIGIVANVTVIAVLTIREYLQKKHIISNVFVINLAVADLLFLAILPFYMPALVIDGWKYGRIWCTITEAIKYINYRASILFLTTMTVDRFFAIVYSLESLTFRVRKNGYLISLLAWVVSFSFSIPILIYTKLYDGDGSVPKCHFEFPGYETPFLKEDELYEYYQNLSEEYSNYEFDNTTNTSEQNFFAGNQSLNCMDYGHANSTTYFAWIYINFFLFFLIPTVLIIYTYGRIILVTTSKEIVNATDSDRHKQLAIMVALLVSAFIVCWLPFQMFELLTLQHRFQVIHRNDCLIYKTLFSMLAWSNSAINPIIYTISSRRFKHKFLMAWTFTFQGRNRALSEFRSQRTMLTRLHTVGRDSLKGVNASIATKNCRQHQLLSMMAS